MRFNCKYTKEKLEPLVKKSKSIAGVVRLLGLKESGGNHTHINKKIKLFEIDTSHFIPYTKNLDGWQGWNKKEWQEILIENKHGRRTLAYKLRRALIESGRPYICENCGLKGEWNDKPIVLEIDHKNYNWLDNRPNNVQFLCPNCHSQRPNHKPG